MGAKGVPEVHSCGELFNFNLCFCDCYCTILHYEAGKLSVSIIVFLRHTSVGNYTIFHGLRTCLSSCFSIYAPS